MFIIYVDESGDPGPTPPSPSKYFVLTGMVLHELRWLDTLDALVKFRRGARRAYGLKMRAEIHAAELIRSPMGLTVPRWQRLQLLGDVLQMTAALPDVNLINVKVDKTTKGADVDVFEMAWTTLLQRFHNTIAAGNFPGPKNSAERGVVVADNTNERKLRTIIRKMRRFNVVPGMAGMPSRALPTTSIIKDPVLRNSGHSYFLQHVDVAAYFLHQMFNPNAFVRKQGARNFFRRLDPVLCKVASPGDPHGLGIVHR